MQIQISLEKLNIKSSKYVNISFSLVAGSINMQYQHWEAR